MENKFLSLFAALPNGLTINICASVLLAFVIGCCVVPNSNFLKALARANGFPQISAPVASALNSLDLLMANWIIVAAIGPRMASNNEPKTSFPFLESANTKANLPQLARATIIPAIVAATELMRISLFLICPISCEITPLNSSSFNKSNISVVTATTAWFWFRPVAKALGSLDWITAILGFFIPALFAKSVIILCKFGASCSETILALYDLRAILSL